MDSSATTINAGPIVSRGLLLSKSCQTLYNPSSTQIKGMERKYSLAVSKLLEIVKHKLCYGAKILPIGHEGRIFSKNFSTHDSEKSVKTYSAEGEVLKFQYKVSIPLGKIKGVRESVNMKRPSSKYVELVTVDDFSFWFLGFTNYKKALRFLLQRISQNCLSN
ncbi:hypothetical protein E3N88_17066 [Mikania micrantha]|uniref:GRAM domain-containing protein n=1 Tax=Mikania micrantha TaxID=192012 RepID=A0A5N6NSA2_9ASTR|nr:hypothetical protein E3N88_17066 [Mikania micrantha]